MPTKPRLKNVTVCSADCLHADLAGRALDICVERADFADAVLFSDTPVAGRFRWEQIPRLASSSDYSLFCLQSLAKRTSTRFVLVVQWDGYIVDPGAWTNEFLRYDYIGAPGFSSEEGRHRPWVVGNGGFSIRSRRLLEATATLPAVDGIAEDRLICEVFRDVLERDHGVRFAPEALADRFCFFQRHPRGPTFGFHGFYNLHRAGDDDAVMDVVSRLTHQQRIHSDIFTLIHLSLGDGRSDLARRLYAVVRSEMTADEIRALLAWQSKTAGRAEVFFDRLQALEPTSAG